MNPLPRSLRLFLIFVCWAISGCFEGSKPPEKPTGGESNSPPPKSSVASASTSDAGGRKVLKMARIPFTDATTMVRDHQLFLVEFARALGYDEVQLKLAKDYDHAIAKLEAREVEIAWAGTLNYIKFKEKLDLIPVVKITRHGKDFYRGQIIVHVESGINTLADLKGKSMGFVEESSASGYLYPKALLLLNGLKYPEDFSRVQFLGKHDNVVLNVLLKKIDGGACFEDARTTLKDPEKEKLLKVIGATENIANEPVICRRDLDPSLQEKIKSALLSFNDPKFHEMLKTIGNVGGFSEAQDGDYDYVRKVENLLAQTGK